MYTRKIAGLDRELHWPAVLGLGFIHVVALCAIWPGFFSWSGLIIAVFLGWLSGWLGITLCFHRLLTHRSFETPKWFEYFLTICGTLAWQGGPITWVGTHRIHHAYSDEDGDPHSPRHGPWWAHVFWTVFKRPIGARDPWSVAKDLSGDKGTFLIDRFFGAPQFVVTI
ncbi:MAG: acyl-CoA desaturase, partial [Patescibacteria group bacterium]